MKRGASVSSAMADLVQEETATTTVHMSSKKELLSTALKRTSEWIFSQEIPSDVTIHAGEGSFSLHKFPLVSKCGYIRKLVSESSDAEHSVIELHKLPGGADAFELAAKFCYGINFEITTENIAALRCVAEYLEMTEDYAVGNLVGRTEAYLNEVTLTSLAGAVSVLHVSQNLLPIAERVKLVSRCIDAIAYIACKESQFCTSRRAEGVNEGIISSSVSHSKAILDWWAEDLTVLRIDIFHRVLIAMMARGFKQYALGPILMLYAQKSLRGLEIFGRGRKKIEPSQEHEKRVVLETIVSLLPREKKAMSLSFLSMLLRAAIFLETTVACRLDLEKRMGMQLGHAVLDDLLIPSYSFTGDTLFDVDTVQRILMNFLEYEIDGNRLIYNAEDEFIGLGELIPEQPRVTEDGIYRAIDIYLKAHPALGDLERKKVCSLMDCQKLSREACAHAAQNERLPVQTVVQVLYYEQQRLRDVMNGGGGLMDADSPTLPSKLNLYSTDIRPVSDELSSLRRENEGLKIELMKLKMKLKEIERSTHSSSVSSPMKNALPSADKPPLPRKSFISSVSKKLGRLSPFIRSDGATANIIGRMKPNKDRRHSIS
ncbi:hypothetical protein F2P56_013833 [Juglans regia]|uniref:BTB/POZ domain-containing protein SR1IP1-like n=1 Tax=Juglans regia TaxID=51240 RepID=A0A834CSY0_JUGRE|nr:hypothetical protein F2P56_013833 [Juglans regia]